MFLIRKDNGKQIVVTSYGDLGIRLNDRVDLVGDQTCRSMGQGEVIGIHHFATGEILTDVTTFRALPHYVCK